MSFNLSNAGEIFWLNPKVPYLSLEKEKETLCVVFTYFIKRTGESRKFHVAVVQQRLRNLQKSEMHTQSCFFASLNLLFFCCWPLPLQKFSIVVIQKFCCHGNVTSHFSSLLQILFTHIAVNQLC